MTRRLPRLRKKDESLLMKSEVIPAYSSPSAPNEDYSGGVFLKEPTKKTTDSWKSFKSWDGIFLTSGQSTAFGSQMVVIADL